MSRNNLKILFLEDNVDDLFLMKRILTRAGIQFISDVVSVKSELLKALDQNTYDMILSDFQLENFDCVDALNLCRERNVNIPFVLVSGMVSEQQAKKLLANGLNAYILKDNLKELPEIITNNMNKGANHNQE